MADALRTMRTRPATMSSIRASATTASCGTVTVTAADDGTGENGGTGGNGGTGENGGTGTDGPSGFELGDGLSDIEIAGISATGLAALAAAGYFITQQQ